MLVKQGMKKKQACDHLKVKPGTIDIIKKNCNLQSTHYFGRRKKPKMKVGTEVKETTKAINPSLIKKYKRKIPNVNEPNADKPIQNVK
jgi:hypothetical protein